MPTTNFTSGTLIESPWLNEVDSHVFDQGTTSHKASTVTVLDSGLLFTATDVEGVLAELQGNIQSTMAAHLTDTIDAHDASAISNVPAGTIAATDVQAAINELDTEKQPIDALLTAIAGQTTAAAKVQGYSGVDTVTLYDFLDEDTMVSNSATAVPSQQSTKAYVDNKLAAFMVSGTAVSATGTTIDFTVPAGVRTIQIGYAGVSTNGTSIPLVRLGTAGGIETTGYLGGSSNMPNAAATSGANRTEGFGIHSASAANIFHGSIYLMLVDSTTNTWVESGTLNFSNAAASVVTSGSKILPSALTTISLTTVNGTDAYDAGTVNIIYTL